MDRRKFLKTSAALSGFFFIANEAQPQEPKEVFSTGLPNLDALMKGGFRKGELAVVLAPSCAGKTAFVRTIRHANFPHHSGDMAVSKGSNDLLFLAPTSSIILTDMEVGLSEADTPWERMMRTANDIRRQAVISNEAIIWTVPTLSHPEGCVSVTPGDFPSFIRSADYAFSIRNNTVNLYKNRGGKNGSVNVEFYHHNGMALMRERS